MYLVGVVNMLITQSSIKKFQDCEYKFKQRYLDLYREDKESEPLVMGSLVHLGLEAFLLGKALPKALHDVEKESLSYRLCEEDSALTDRAKIFVQGYYKRYKSLHKKQYKTISVEQEFIMQLGDCTIGGKFDGVIQDKKTKEIILIEHKTSGDWTAKTKHGTYWQQRHNCMDTQLVIYQEALKRMLDLDYTPRIIYDVIYKDKPKMKDLLVMSEHYQSDKAPYYREEIVYTESDRERALWEYATLAKRIQDRMIDGDWIRNTNACRKGYGMCEFFKVCQGLESLETSDKLTKLEKAHPELPELMGENNGK